MLMPVLQQVFQMPTQYSGMTRGSDQWIQAVIKRGRFSYVDCVEFEPLMDAYVESLLLKCLSTNGYPEKKHGEEPIADKL